VLTLVARVGRPSLIGATVSDAGPLGPRALVAALGAVPVARLVLAPAHEAIHGRRPAMLTLVARAGRPSLIGAPVSVGAGVHSPALVLDKSMVRATVI